MREQLEVPGRTNEYYNIFVNEWPIITFLRTHVVAETNRKLGEATVPQTSVDSSFKKYINKSETQIC